MSRQRVGRGDACCCRRGGSVVCARGGKLNPAGWQERRRQSAVPIGLPLIASRYGRPPFAVAPARCLRRHPPHSAPPVLRTFPPPPPRMAYAPRCRIIGPMTAAEVLPPPRGRVAAAVQAVAVAAAVAEVVRVAAASRKPLPPLTVLGRWRHLHPSWEVGDGTEDGVAFRVVDPADVWTALRLGRYVALRRLEWSIPTPASLVEATTAAAGGDVAGAAGAGGAFGGRAGGAPSCS